MIEDFNKAVVVVGPPQYGKTTKAIDQAVEHLRAYPTGLVLAHDPNRQFRSFCGVYETVSDWRRALDQAARTKTEIPRGSSVGGSAADVTRAAVELGKARNVAGKVRVPIFLVFDESSLMETSGGSFMGKEETQLLSNRRHWGIAPLYNVQRPTALTEAFYSMSTDVFIFGQPSERRTAILEEYLGLRAGVLAWLVGAPKFTYAHWRAGEGLV